MRAAGGFLNLSIKPAADLTLEAGVRADWLEFELDDDFLDDGDDSGQRTFSQLSPGAGARKPTRKPERGQNIDHKRQKRGT